MVVRADRCCKLDESVRAVQSMCMINSTKVEVGGFEDYIRQY